MSLHITIVPASTQAGRATIESLLKRDGDFIVHGIYRNPTKVPINFKSNQKFIATQGDLSTNSGLDFSKSDAVFYVPPPVFDGTDSADFATSNAKNVKDALAKSPNVKRLVVFSATSAQHDKGNGVLKINRITDTILKDSVPEVVIAKGSWFMENWASALETIKAEQPYFEAYFTPLDHKIAMVSIADVGEICAQQLSQVGHALPTVPYVFDIFGPRNYSAIDLENALEEVSGKKVEAIPIEPVKLVEFFGKVLPSPYAEEHAEMVLAARPGGIVSNDMQREGNGIIRGTSELVDVLRQLAAGETSKAQSGAF